MSKALKYIKRNTKHMTPSERYQWVVREIYEPLRAESIQYVNGELIPIPDEIDTVGEAVLQKEIKSGAYAD